MKKILKKCGIVSLCIIGVGILFLVIGLISGGRIGFTIDIHGQKVITKDTKAESYVEKTVDLDAFSQLEVNVNAADVEIKRGESYQVQYYMLSSEVPTIEVKNKKLIVNSKDMASVHSIVNFQFFDFEFLSSDSKREGIVITVPKDIELSEANVKVESGNITLTDLTIHTAYASSAYGDVKVSNFISDEVNFSSESGDIELTNVEMKQNQVVTEYGKLTVKECSGENGTFVLESGDCRMEALELQQLQVTNQYGEIELKKSILDSCKADCENGDIIVDECTVKKAELYAEYGNILIEKSIIDQIQSDCESGDTKVDLQGELSEYNLDLITESGEIKINGQENGENYKNITDKEKSIKAKNEYGNIDILIE